MDQSSAFKGLNGKSAVLAGGCGGIGSATSRRLARSGVKLVIGDLNGDAATAMADELVQGGAEAIGVGCDVSRPEDVSTLFKMAVERHGGVDLLFANAADVGSDLFRQDRDIIGAPLESFDRAVAINLRGLLLCTREAIPMMLERGGGSIVYTSSEAAFIGSEYSNFYGATKAGLNSLMRDVAFVYGRRGVRANAISPGMIVNENTRKMATKAEVEAQLAVIRTPQLGEVDEIASLAAYLLSDECRFLQGQVISVSGGLTMR